MNFKKLAALVSIFILNCVLADVSASVHGQKKVDEPKYSRIELITAEELKAKVARNEPVTIIDVRASSAYADSDDKIRGAIRVKLRKLKSRLALPPLKDVPRDREIVTYCACPSDQTSIRAAQMLLDAGFHRVRALKGGWRLWLKASGQVESRPKVS